MQLDDLVRELKALAARERHGPLPADALEQKKSLLEQLAEQLRQQDDRRSEPRIPGGLEVRFQMHGTTLSCAASDLSPGGLTLQSHLWRVLEGQELVVDAVRIADADFPLSIRARMIWTPPQGDERPHAGLQFLDLDDEKRKRIESAYKRMLLSYAEQK
jgi:hypothetical protein